MRKINRKKEMIVSFIGIFIAVIGICCVIMEWGTALYLIISIIFICIFLRSFIETRCPYCGKFALTMGLWHVIQKRQVRCKKCGESIEYSE